MDAVLAQQRVLLQLSDLIADRECRLASSLSCSGLVLQPTNPFLRPAVERGVNGGPTRMQLCRHFPLTRSLLQGIEFSNKARNRCIQVPFVDRSEESSKERNSPS